MNFTTTQKELITAASLFLVFVLAIVYGGETVRYLVYLFGCWMIGSKIHDVTSWFVRKFWN